jgi:hypothetical protein
MAQFSGVRSNHPIGVWYNGSQWGVYNEDGATMPSTAAFNVMFLP